MSSMTGCALRMDNMENVIENLLGDEYRECYNLAKTMFTDEQAIQSCCATLMIQYHNIKRNSPKLNELIAKYNQIIEEQSKAVPQPTPIDNTETLELYFAPLIAQYPKAKGYVDKLIEQNCNLKVAIEKMNDYMKRNGFVFKMMCSLGPDLDAVQASADNKWE